MYTNTFVLVFAETSIPVSGLTADIHRIASECNAPPTAALSSLSVEM